MDHDTTPAAARVRWDVLSRMTAEQRLRQALELTDLVMRIHADGRRERAERRAPAPRPETPAPSELER